MNVLTVGASLGAITFIYQGGPVRPTCSATRPTAASSPADFLVAAALVFALSTDYGVFLLGRIKEARDAGALRARGGRHRARSHRQHRHGRGDPAGRRDRRLQHQRDLVHAADRHRDRGRGGGRRVRGPLAAGGPSLMALLGKWNWWAPMWLRRVHDRVGLERGWPRGPRRHHPRRPGSDRSDRTPGRVARRYRCGGGPAPPRRSTSCSSALACVVVMHVEIAAQRQGRCRASRQPRDRRRLAARCCCAAGARSRRTCSGFVGRCSASSRRSRPYNTMPLAGGRSAPTRWRERHGRRAVVHARLVVAPARARASCSRSARTRCSAGDRSRTSCSSPLPLALGVAAHARRAYTDDAHRAGRGGRAHARGGGAAPRRRGAAADRARRARRRRPRDGRRSTSRPASAPTCSTATPRRRYDTLRNIKQVSGDALTDLRAMLGLLREPPTSPRRRCSASRTSTTCATRSALAGVDLDARRRPCGRLAAGAGRRDRLPDRPGGARPTPCATPVRPVPGSGWVADGGVGRHRRRRRRGYAAGRNLTGVRHRQRGCVACASGRRPWAAGFEAGPRGSRADGG